MPNFEPSSFLNEAGRTAILNHYGQAICKGAWTEVGRGFAMTSMMDVVSYNKEPEFLAACERLKKAATPMPAPALVVADPAMMAAFTKAITGSPDGVMRLRFIHDRDKKQPSAEREGSLSQIGATIAEFQALGFGVFYFLNEIKRGEGFATDADVTRIRFLAIDADAGLPTEFHAPPDLVVKTSVTAGVQRGQVLWRAPEDCRVADFKQVQKQLAAYYHTDPAVSNPSRVFRLPGTLHIKHEPMLVTFTRGAV